MKEKKERRKKKRENERKKRKIINLLYKPEADPGFSWGRGGGAQKIMFITSAKPEVP